MAGWGTRAGDPNPSTYSAPQQYNPNQSYAAQPWYGNPNVQSGASSGSGYNPQQGSGNTLTDFYNLGRTVNAPQDAADQSFIDRTKTRQALSQADYQSGSRYLNQDLASQMSNYDLQQQGLDVKRGALGRQPGYLSANYGLDQQSLGLDSQDIQAQSGLENQTYGLDMQSLGNRQQLLDQLFGVSSGDISARQQHAQYQETSGEFQAQANATSETNTQWRGTALHGFGGATQRGQGVTVGNRERLGEIQTQLHQTLSDLQENLQFTLGSLGREQQATSAKYQSDKADIGIQGQKLGAQHGYQQGQFGRDQSKIGLKGQRLGLDYNENMAQIGDQNKALNLAYSKIGLDRKDAQNRMQRSLDQLGLSNYVTIDDLEQAIIDRQTGKYNRHSDLLNQVDQMEGLGFSSGSAGGNSGGGNYGTGPQGQRTQWANG